MGAAVGFLILSVAFFAFVLLCSAAQPTVNQVAESSLTLIEVTLPPQATSTPSPVNLAPINQWPLKPYGLSQYVYVDTAVLCFGEVSLRVEPDYDMAVNGGTQNDRAVYPNHAFACKEGDRVVFSAYMKTESSSKGHDGRVDKGARIGIDYYSYNVRITSSPPNVPSVAAGSFVPWGTSGWTLFTYDMIVPAGYDVTCCIPWLQVLDATDTGNAWFGNIQLNIYSE
jgi:hypothetical protein